MCGFISFIYAVSTSSLTQKCRQSQHRQVKASLLLKNSPAFLGLQLESVSPGPRGDHLVVSAWGHGSVPQRIGPVGGMSPKGARCTPRAFLGLGCTLLTAGVCTVHGLGPVVASGCPSRRCSLPSCRNTAASGKSQLGQSCVAGTVPP